ncbi:uncharacterized protein LOC118646934 [Monomorium pharaonis]|uniref:uncharacterized protein LOC118646934 n=1 Tax=Monomorium pharaonis TaxID=307658 RepID=UPI001745F7A1|nr:uncharacterized protein LOC118646934 [Monomorium pharaonis]
MENKKKGSWDKDNLKTALDKVLSKKMGLREAALKYSIPKSTLHDKITCLKSGEEIALQPKLGRFTKTFLPEYEEQLLNHVKDLSNRCLPLMKKEFLKLAYDLAVELKLPHRFNTEKRTAGKHFYYDFMARHPDLSLRTPESTSMMRAVGFNKLQVDLFFSNLEKLMNQYNFPPSNIYNCDETGVSCVQKHQKVLAPKAVRQVGKLTSAERGKNITIMFCMSANGYFIPPFFIFPRMKMNERLMINAPSQSEGVAQPKGWMNSDFFCQWLKHFEKFSHPSKESPVLLLLDGHSSHKSLDVINFCREHNIHLISSPPHTTHKLQPLDRTFMKPFKNAYHERCDMWMRANAGARITDYDIAGLVGEAFTKVARLDIAVSGFKCTGIYPFDKNIFSDIDYLPSDMTNVPLEEIRTQTAPVASKVLDAVPVRDTQMTKEIHPSTSSVPDISKNLLKLSPFPDAAKKRSEARKRKSEKSQILTSSPYKILVEEKENERKGKKAKKSLEELYKETNLPDKKKRNKAPKTNSSGTFIRA